LNVLRVGYLRRRQSLPASLALPVSISGRFCALACKGSAGHRRAAAIRHRKFQIYEELR
jgi:hypothetical protein